MPLMLNEIYLISGMMPVSFGIRYSMFAAVSNSYLIGAVVTVGVGWFSQNLLLTIVVGMGAFLGWQWLVSIV